MPSDRQVWGTDSDTSRRRRGRRSRTAPLSPPPPCAGHQSGRPGAAASRRGAILYLHRLSAVLLRAVLRARAVRPDRRRRATFRWPGAVPTRTAIMGGQPGGGSAPILNHRRRALLCRPCAVFASILVRAGPGALRPDYDSNFDCHPRRRAPATPMTGPAPLPHAWVVLALPPAQRSALSGRRPGKGSAPRSPDACHLPLARSWAPLGRHPGVAVRSEYDHPIEVTIIPPLRARSRCFAPNDDLALPLARALHSARMGRRPGRSSAPFKRSLRRRDCHLRRRAPAARATGPAPPLSSQRAVRRYCDLASLHRRRVCPLSHRAPATCWAGPAPQLRYRRLPSWSGCSPRRFRSTRRWLYLLSPPLPPPPLLPPRPGTGVGGSAPQSGCAGSQQGMEGQRGRCLLAAPGGGGPD